MVVFVSDLVSVIVLWDSTVIVVKLHFVIPLVKAVDIVWQGTSVSVSQGLLDHTVNSSIV